MERKILVAVGGTDLWIVSGEPSGRHFMVPVDCSIHTLNAVDHLGFMLRGDEERDYSTIVMGRRLDEEKNIFKGVSDRVLANIDNAALWVVG